MKYVNYDDLKNAWLKYGAGQEHVKSSLRKGRTAEPIFCPNGMTLLHAFLNCARTVFTNMAKAE